jgi:hypothetical protein
MGVDAYGGGRCRAVMRELARAPLGTRVRAWLGLTALVFGPARALAAAPCVSGSRQAS